MGDKDNVAVDIESEKEVDEIGRKQTEPEESGMEVEPVGINDKAKMYLPGKEERGDDGLFSAKENCTYSLDPTNMRCRVCIMRMEYGKLPERLDLFKRMVDNFQIATVSALIICSATHLAAAGIGGYAVALWHITDDNETTFGGELRWS